MNSLPNGFEILPENGVGKYALYTQYGERISVYDFWEMRLAIFTHLTGIKLR